jgi:hypothetical protein
MKTLLTLAFLLCMATASPAASNAPPPAATITNWTGYQARLLAQSNMMFNLTNKFASTADIATATGSLPTSAITNGLATIASVSAAVAGLVTATVTNDLSSRVNASNTVLQAAIDGRQISSANLTLWAGHPTNRFLSTNVLTTKGDVGVFNGSAWVRVGVGSDNQVLTAASGQASGVQWATPSGSNPWTLVSKPTIQTKTANTTLANDTDLTFSVTSGTKYRVRGTVYFDTTAAGDFKYAIAGPAASLIRVHKRHQAAAGVAYVTATDTAFATSTAVAGTGTAGGQVFFDVLFVATASGTFAFQWAQNTSDAGNTSVNAGSYLERSTY